MAEVQSVTEMSQPQRVAVVKVYHGGPPPWRIAAPATAGTRAEALERLGVQRSSAAVDLRLSFSRSCAAR